MTIALRDLHLKMTPSNISFPQCLNLHSDIGWLYFQGCISEGDGSCNNGKEEGIDHYTEKDFYFRSSLR